MYQLSNPLWFQLKWLALQLCIQRTSEQEYNFSPTILGLIQSPTLWEVNKYIFTGSLSPAGKPDPYYEPVPLELYVQFSFLSYFMAFIGILLLQSLTIFITDIFVLKNMPSNVTLCERIIHVIQKSQLPFPIQNWHEGKGSCLDHIKRHKLVQKEVLTATVINLAFNMVMLIPLVILCKFKNLL